MASPPFAPIEPGASLCLAWQVRNKPVVLIGGGAVAAGRLLYLLESGARVTLICPRDGMCEEVRWRVEEEGLVEKFVDRTFGGVEDIEGAYMVLTAIDEVGLSSKICAMCRERKIIVNVADVPPECDFYFGSMIRQGPLQILFSTSGKGPRIAARIRQRTEAAIPSCAGKAISTVGDLRAKLRKKAPGVGGERGRRRMKWMIDVCDAWTLEELAEMTEEEQMKVLEGWEEGKVVTKQQLLPWYRRTPFLDSWRRCPYHDRIDGSWFGPGAVGFGLGVLTTFAVLLRVGRR